MFTPSKENQTAKCPNIWPGENGSEKYLERKLSPACLFEVKPVTFSTLTRWPHYSPISNFRLGICLLWLQRALSAKLTASNDVTWGSVSWCWRRQVWKWETSGGVELERSELSQPLKLALHVWLRLVAWGDTSCYKHNTHESPTELLHCGKRRCQVLTRVKNVWNKKTISLVLLHRFRYLKSWPPWVWQCYRSVMQHWWSTL